MITSCFYYHNSSAHASNQHCFRLPPVSILSILLLTCLSAIPSKTLAGASVQWAPIGFGDPADYYYYNDIPFDLEDGEGLSVEHRSEILPNWVGEFHKPSDTLSLDFIGNPSASYIHIIQYCYYATAAPNGAVVGSFIAHYMDGSQDSADLIVGVNTAEWAYDRPENQPYLNHTKITPAYSYETTTDSYYSYQGHNFLLSLDVEYKPLSSLELTLDPASYNDYGMFGMEWFGIGVGA